MTTANTGSAVAECAAMIVMRVLMITEGNTGLGARRLVVLMLYVLTTPRVLKLHVTVWFESTCCVVRWVDIAGSVTN